MLIFSLKFFRAVELKTWNLPIIAFILLEISQNCIRFAIYGNAQIGEEISSSKVRILEFKEKLCSPHSTRTFSFLCNPH